MKIIIVKLITYLGWFCIYLFIFSIFLASITIIPIDRTPYQETNFYKNTFQNFQKIIQQKKYLHSKGDTLEVGWSKESITPSYPIEMTGYLNRKESLFNCIIDSLFVRTFVFDNGTTQIAVVNMDLLIVPPAIVAQTAQELTKVGFPANQIYYNATHTHSSIGGWGDNWVGYFFAGKYKPEIVKMIAKKIVKSILQSQKNKQKASIGYEKYLTQHLTMNRLVGRGGEIDAWLRIIKIKQITGKEALLVSYAAHPTCLSEKITCLAGDYPSDLMQEVEKNTKIDMVSFMAGAMASQGSVRVRRQPDEIHKHRIATELAKIIISKQSKIKGQYKATKISLLHLPVQVRDPHFRIAQNWALRSWVYDWIYGRQAPFVKALRIGNIVFIGMPCDFSGELVKQFEPICQEKQVELWITSFNGAYIGYITNDQWYDKKGYETYDMAWHGPQNGAYFSEIIQKIIKSL